MLWPDCKLTLKLVDVKDENVRIAVFVNDDLVCEVLNSLNFNNSGMSETEKMCELKARGKILDLTFISQYHMT